MPWDTFWTIIVQALIATVVGFLITAAIVGVRQAIRDDDKPPRPADVDPPL